MAIEPISWVDIVGYQHEVVHIGVLDRLLRSGVDGEDDVRRCVAECLVGEPVFRVRQPCREARAGGRGRADLVVDLELATRKSRVAVECKVDSAWTKEQLGNTLGQGDRGVLFALGSTSLVASDADMPEGWRVLGLDTWEKTLRELGLGGCPVIKDYCAQLNAELTDHRAARGAACNNQKLETRRRGSTDTLAHWAYFGGTLEKLDDRRDWSRSALVSGPLLTRWFRFANDADVSSEAAAGVYLEFMGLPGQRRELKVKAWSEDRSKLSSLIDALGPVPSMDRPKGKIRRDSKTGTAATTDLGRETPSKAAARADELLRDLHEPAGDALRSVFA